MESIKKVKFENLNNEQFETLTKNQLFKMQGGNATDSSGITVSGTDTTPTDNAMSITYVYIHSGTNICEANYWGYSQMDSTCG